jgi:serine/threonine protein kinase/Tol biopolymer transport system component
MAMGSSLERGSLLHKRYRIVEILGQGGMGSVYRGVDENLGVDVAVKENLFTTEEYARQFRLEAVILANLRHTNLPRVTDHFVIGEQGQYLIMDYIEGEDLRQRMERSGAISEEEAILIGAAMCDALHYLHTRKPSIIHRDVKPGNVRITPDGHIYLVDFGLAKLVKGSQATTTGARAMTPGYSPPEQYGTARTDPRTDVYSLGATLYAALTGIIPEDGLARAMDNVELTPLRRRNPKVSRKLAAAIEKAMAVRPEDRFQTAEEFKQALLISNIKTQRLENDLVVEPPPQAPETEDGGPLVPSANGGGQPILTPPSKPRKNRKVWSTNLWIFFSFFLLTILLAVLGVVLFWSPISAALRDLLATSTPDMAETSAFPPTNGETTPGENDTPVTTFTATKTLRPSATQTATPAETATLTPTVTLQGGGYGQLAIVSTRAGIPQVFLVNADGSNMTQVSNMPDGACQPDWSPDGARLVFISPCEKRLDEYPDAKIYIINVDGSGLTELPIPEGGFEPVWAPDGQRIAFTSDLSGLYQIHLFNLNDNQITPLTEKSSDTRLPDWSRYPAWSRTGTQIVYTGHSQLTGALQIWVMSDAGRANTRLVLNEVTFWDFQPTWSPDGRTIYFSETNGPQALGWLMQFDYEHRDDPDASQVPNGNYATDISVSPDVRWLAFESTEDGKHYDVFLMTPDGENRALLTTDPGQEYDPVWRPLP